MLAVNDCTLKRAGSWSSEAERMIRWLQTEKSLFAAENAATRNAQQAPGLMKMAVMMSPQRTEHTERWKHKGKQDWKASMAVLSEDWDLETGDGGTWESSGHEEEELNFDPNETQAPPPCPMVGWGTLRAWHLPLQKVVLDLILLLQYSN